MVVAIVTFSHPSTATAWEAGKGATMFGKAKVAAVLPVEDIDRTKSWYKDHLGVVPDAEGDTPEGFQITMGDVPVYFYKTEAPRGGTTALGFMVDDFDGWVRDLRAHEVKFEDYDLPDLHTENGIAEYMGVKSAWFKDSEGNILNIADAKAMAEAMKRAA